MGFVFTLPESPRWLVKMSRIEEAKGIFSAIYEVPSDSETVHKNIRDIQLSLELGQNVGLYVYTHLMPPQALGRVMRGNSSFRD